MQYKYDCMQVALDYNAAFILGTAFVIRAKNELKF